MLIEGQHIIHKKWLLIPGKQIVNVLNQFYLSVFLKTFREGTPQYSGSIENLSAHDEVLHLRKQVAKLNRRLLNVEIDNLQRNQREKIICCVGLAYFVLKTLFWLNRK